RTARRCDCGWSGNSGTSRPSISSGSRRSTASLTCTGAKAGTGRIMSITNGMQGFRSSPEVHQENEPVPHPLKMFDEVRIINLVDRVDRRREMSEQLEGLGGMPPNASFFEAHRPG